MNNVFEVYAFLDAIGEGDGILTTARSTGHPAFSAAITYKSEKANKVAVTTVSIEVLSGPDEGTVSLAEVPGLKSDKFHMDFRPRFKTTTFKFDRAMKTLVIAGNSEKMGAYEVVIAPVGG